MGQFDSSRPIADLVAEGVQLVKGGTNVVVGATETLITRPGDERILVLDVSGSATALYNVIPGDYTQVTFNSTGDVDATQETIVITGVEDRMDGPDAFGRLVFGPAQFSGTLPTGLSVNTSYWIAKPQDVGVATDEVAVYLTLAAAQAAGIDGTDGRIDLTVAVGTGNFTGMANNELGATPAATTTDGYNSVPLRQGRHVISAPSKLTVLGSGTTPSLTYWWLQ